MVDAFEILELDPRFDVDLDDLHRRYVRLSARNHPDRFTDPVAQIEAAERAAAINEAYQTLHDPQRRAEALLAILGGPDRSDDKALPPDLLLKMMEVHEEVEQAQAEDDEEALTRLRIWAQEEKAAHLQRVGGLLGQAARAEVVARAALLKQVRLELNALRYFQRMLDQLTERSG